MNWNQPICNACWTRRHPERMPVRVRERTVETCAYCGRETDSGIYVRDNPDRVPYPQPGRTS